MPSQSQASTIVARGGRGAAGAAAAGPAGMRRRPGAGRSTGSGSSKQQTNFYMDDTPGWKISPGVVIGMSVGFIIFVTVLHIVGKLRGA